MYMNNYLLDRMGFRAQESYRNGEYKSQETLTLFKIRFLTRNIILSRVSEHEAEPFIIPNSTLVYLDESLFGYYIGLFLVSFVFIYLTMFVILTECCYEWEVQIRGIHYWTVPGPGPQHWYSLVSNKHTNLTQGLYIYHNLCCHWFWFGYRVPNNYDPNQGVVADEQTELYDVTDPATGVVTREVRRERRGGKSATPTYVHLASYLQRFIIYPHGVRKMDIVVMMHKGRAWLTDNTNADSLHHTKILMMAIASLSEPSPLEEQVMHQLLVSGVLETPNY